MAQKISGWTRPVIDMHPMNLAASFTVRANKCEGEVRCTVVIGDERVFTESEVRAMVREMVEGVTAGEEFTMESIAQSHGIFLDPDQPTNP